MRPSGKAVAMLMQRGPVTSSKHDLYRRRGHDRARDGQLAESARHRNDEDMTLEVGLTGWAITIALIVGLLVVDLGVAGARPHVQGFREAGGGAVACSLFYVGVAVVFGVVFGALAGSKFGVQYFTGYIVEKSLSVDNLFV